MVIVKNEANGTTIQLTEEQVDLIYDALEDLRLNDEDNSDNAGTIQNAIYNLFK